MQKIINNMEKQIEKFKSQEEINFQLKEKISDGLEKSDILKQLRDRAGSFESNIGVNWRTAEECNKYLKNIGIKNSIVYEEARRVRKEAEDFFNSSLKAIQKIPAHLERTWFEHAITSSSPDVRSYLYFDKKDIDFYTKEGIKIKIKDILNRTEQLFGSRQDIFLFYINADYNNLVFLKKNV